MMFKPANLLQKSSKQSKTLGHKLIGATLSAALVVTVAMPMAAITQVATAATANENLIAAKRLNNLLINTKSMSANFTQTTKGTDGSKSGLAAKNGTFSGTMSLKRPNKFRWQITSPFEQLIVTNGSSLWVYDKDLEQVTQQSTDKQLGNTPALLLSGDPSQISKNFKITQPKVDKNYYVLFPKAKNSNYKSLAISFNSGKPVMMVLNDSLGQVTSIKFNKVTLNPAIADSQFKFTPPKGVDVINQ